MIKSLLEEVAELGMAVVFPVVFKGNNDSIVEYNYSTFSNSIIIIHASKRLNYRFTNLESYTLQIITYVWYEILCLNTIKKLRQLKVNKDDYECFRKK